LNIEAYNSGDYTFHKLKTLIQINKDLRSSERARLGWRRMFVCLLIGSFRLGSLMLYGLDTSSG